MRFKIQSVKIKTEDSADKIMQVDCENAFTTTIEYTNNPNMLSCILHLSHAEMPPALISITFSKKTGEHVSSVMWNDNNNAMASNGYHITDFQIGVELTSVDKIALSYAGYEQPFQYKDVIAAVLEGGIEYCVDDKDYL